MKSKTDELTEKAFYHAMNFFKSNDRGVDNQRLCFQQLMEITGFDFDTCLKIQNPILDFYMQVDMRNIGQSVIENNLQMVTQNIRNHLLNIQINHIQKPVVSSSFKSIAPHDYSGASQEDIDKHFVTAYDNSNKRLDINGFLKKGDLAICRTVKHLEYLTKSKDKHVLSEKKHLNFSFNLMNDESVSYLASFLHWQELNLTQLNLGYNRISNVGIESLFYNLRNAPDVRTHNIQYINFSNNNVGDYGADYITQSLISGRYPNLRYLDVSGNQITDDGQGAFVKAMKNPEVKNFIVIVDTVQKLKEQYNFVFGSKEERITAYKNLIAKGKEKGTYDEAMVVDKSWLGQVKDIYNQGKAALLGGWGFSKCHLVPEDMATGYAQDKLVAKIPMMFGGLVKYGAKLVDVQDIVTCYLGASDEAWTSEAGMSVIKNELCLMGESEFCGE
jgi:hypothetical protein